MLIEIFDKKEKSIFLFRILQIGNQLLMHNWKGPFCAGRTLSFWATIEKSVECHLCTNKMEMFVSFVEMGNVPICKTKAILQFSVEWKQTILLQKKLLYFHSCASICTIYNLQIFTIFLHHIFPAFPAAGFLGATGAGFLIHWKNYATCHFMVFTIDVSYFLRLVETDICKYLHHAYIVGSSSV